MTITVFIRYEIDPFGKAAFEQYAHNWGQVEGAGAIHLNDLSRFFVAISSRRTVSQDATLYHSFITANASRASRPFGVTASV
jgi:hypothetical protein